jgi:putative ABC transport system ATP-binding protein
MPGSVGAQRANLDFIEKELFPQKPSGYSRAMPLLEIKALKKDYRGPDGIGQTVLDIPGFLLDTEEHVGLAGISGSGKTTLLHVIAGILKPTAGSVLLAGKDMAALEESARDRWRALHIGYIFQTFNLLPAFTCLENVLLGMAFGPGPDRSKAEKLLERVGLGNRLHHRPQELSTGQQQRVAVARALANRPKLVLADEPTGNLDEINGREVLQLIRDTCRETSAALLLVSHDRQILAQFDRVVDFADLNGRRAVPKEQP